MKENLYLEYEDDTNDIQDYIAFGESENALLESVIVQFIDEVGSDD